MTNLKTLIKKDFFTSFVFRIPSMLKDKKERKKLLIYPFLIIILGGYAYFAIRFLINFIEDYDSVGKGYVYLEQGFFAYTMLLLLASIPALLSNFYYSNDVKSLLTLPIKHSEILLSKIISTGISLMTSALIVILPFTIRYISFYNKSILYGVLILLLTLVYTIAITSIAAFFVVALMSIVNRFSRAKNFLQIFGTLIIIALSIGLSTILNSSEIYTSPRSSVALLLLDKVEQIISYNPFSGLIRMIIQENILALIILTLITIALVLLTSIIGSRLMVIGVLNNQVVSKRKKISEIAKTKIYKPSSPLLQVFKKDFMQILKTPVYMMNTFSMALILPLALAIPLYAQRSNFAEMGISFSEIRQFYPMLETIASKELITGIAFMLSLVISTFMSISGAIAGATSFTREGKNFWLVQTLPISTNDQILGRLLSAFLIGVICCLPINLIILIVLRPPLYILLPYILGILVASFFGASIGVWKDVAKPKLNWESPQKAMKQNLNVLLLTYVLMGLAMAIGFLIWFIGFKQDFTDPIKLIIFALIGLAITGIAIGFILRTMTIFERKLSSYN